MFLCTFLHLRWKHSNKIALIISSIGSCPYYYATDFLLSFSHKHTNNGVDLGMKFTCCFHSNVQPWRILKVVRTHIAVQSARQKHTHTQRGILLCTSFLLCLLNWFFSFHCQTDAGPCLSIQQRSQEDHQCAYPVPGCEWVPEVQYRDDKTQEFAQSHNKCNRKGATLCS